MFDFEVLHCEATSYARLGRLQTAHGVVETPAFMPVGTKGAIRGLTSQQVAETGTRLILANTYHLYLRPGAQIIAEAGGLHRFMDWQGPILTDSGGFQIFSLAQLADADDDGVTFRSHIDGTRLRLDPESAMATQQLFGADIIMAFDQCPPYPCPRATVELAVRRTIAWARRCRLAEKRGEEALFGIVQGGVHEDLRRRCAEAIVELGFEGFAIGGLSVGESYEQRLEVLDDLAPRLPRGSPRYLMGAGMPQDLVEAVRRGIDLFDCVLPTRNGRNAYAFTAGEPLKLRNQQHQRSNQPIEECCDCHACTHYSRGYIRHLFNVKEMLGPILTSIHNLRFFQRLMERIRTLIQADHLKQIYQEFPVAS